MTRPTLSCSTDYRFVDGVESVTLAKFDDSASITVTYAKRGMLNKSENDLYGSDAGRLVFDLPAATVTGSITEPLAGMKIADADGNGFSIHAVSYFQHSQVWHCIASPNSE